MALQVQFHVYREKNLFAPRHFRRCDQVGVDEAKLHSILSKRRC